MSEKDASQGFGLGHLVVGLKYVEMGNPRGVWELLLIYFFFFFFSTYYPEIF